MEVGPGLAGLFQEWILVSQPLPCARGWPRPSPATGASTQARILRLDPPAFLHPTGPTAGCFPAVATENPLDCSSLCYFSKILPHLPLPSENKRQNPQLGVQGTPKFNSGLLARAGLPSPLSGHAKAGRHLRGAPTTPHALCSLCRQVHCCIRSSGPGSGHTVACQLPLKPSRAPCRPALCPWHTVSWWFSGLHGLLAGKVFTYLCLCSPWCSAYRGCFLNICKREREF